MQMPDDAERPRSSPCNVSCVMDWNDTADRRVMRHCDITMTTAWHMSGARSWTRRRSRSRTNTSEWRHHDITTMTTWRRSGARSWTRTRSRSRARSEPRRRCGVYLLTWHHMASYGRAEEEVRRLSSDMTSHGIIWHHMNWRHAEPAEEAMAVLP